MKRCFDAKAVAFWVKFTELIAAEDDMAAEIAWRYCKLHDLTMVRNDRLFEKKLLRRMGEPDPEPSEAAEVRE